MTPLLQTVAAHISDLCLPQANAVGYEREQREELGVDTNRDFAYDTSPQSCMRSITARSINEVFRFVTWRFALLSLHIAE